MPMPALPKRLVFQIGLISLITRPLAAPFTYGTPLPSGWSGARLVAGGAAPEVPSPLLRGPAPLSPGMPGPEMPGPWDRDVIVYRVAPGREVERVALFERAGVPTVA